MGCYLEDYRARVGTWAGRQSWRGVSRRGDANGTTGDCLGFTVLSSTVLALLLIIGGIEQNPGPDVEVENTVRLICTGCNRNLKSGIQCELCGRWYHYSCGNVKAVAAERGNWYCEKCRTEKVKILQEELQNALRQIDELKDRNRELEEKLLLVEGGRRDAVPAKQETAKCVVIGDSVLRNVGAEHADMKVECFPGINTEQLNRVMERRDMGSPETAIIHVGTNDLRKTRDLDVVMGDVYELVTTAKKKFPNCRLVLSGVLRRRDVSWRRIGALNNRLDWVANALGLTFVDPNSWLEDWDFARDGLHLNGRGKRRLGQLYARVSGLDAGGSADVGGSAVVGGSADEGGSADVGVSADAGGSEDVGVTADVGGSAGSRM